MPDHKHLSEDQIAALLENGVQGSEMRLMEEHLLACRRCMAAYSDALRLLRAHRQGAAAEVVDEDLLLRARAIGSKPTHDHLRVVNPEPKSGARRRVSGPRWFWGLAAALAISLLAGGMWLRPTGEPAELREHPAVALVSAAIREASATGMILPGQGRAPAPAGRVVRGPASGGPELDAALAAVDELPAADRRELMRASGLVAAGRLDLAQLIVDEGLQRESENPSWPLLAAQIAYRRNDLARAESLLRGILARDPEASESRFNLGLLLAESGRKAEAAEAFEILVERGDAPLAAARATTELTRLRGSAQPD